MTTAGRKGDPTAGADGGCHGPGQQRLAGTAGRKGSRWNPPGRPGGPPGSGGDNNGWPEGQQVEPLAAKTRGLAVITTAGRKGSRWNLSAANPLGRTDPHNNGWPEGQQVERRWQKCSAGQSTARNNGWPEGQQVENGLSNLTSEQSHNNGWPEGQRWKTRVSRRKLPQSG